MSKSLIIAGLALAGAACGTGPQTTAAHPGANPAAISHEFGQCVRDHGQPNFPDPAAGAQGGMQLPPGTGKPSDAIMRACGPILDRLRASLQPSSSPTNDPAMMLRFAQCMRAHGIPDWPDPNAAGSFVMPPSLGDIKASPRWSQIQAAWNGPCRQYDPSGRIGTTGS